MYLNCRKNVSEWVSEDKHGHRGASDLKSLFTYKRLHVSIARESEEYAAYGFILDGISEKGAHVKSKLGYLIC